MRRIRVIVLVAAACILGGATPPVEAKGSVKLTVTTTPVPAPNNVYSPNNAMVAWILGPNGAFVKTIGQYVAIRQPNLVAWRQVAGNTDIDAVVGASRLNHAQPLTLLWNLRDRQGNPVPDGTYTIRLELAEANSTAAGQNNQGTFTFIKGTAPQTQTNLANGGFTNVSIEFDPNAVTCGDGFVDGPDEKCDFTIAAEMPGACPATCVAADACLPVQLQGVGDLCSAECVAGTPITACVNGDGCCASGCSDADDSDCAGPNPPDATGGCETGGQGAGGALAFGALGLALLMRRRRR
jgi:uncharacterized protein (TIGR03382 family)